MRNPMDIVVSLKRLHVELEETSKEYGYVFDDVVQGIEELYTELIGVYEAWESVDAGQDEKDKFIEDNWDGGRF